MRSRPLSPLALTEGVCSDAFWLVFCWDIKCLRETTWTILQTNAETCRRVYRVPTSASYTYAHIPTSVHTYILTYMHTYIHTDMHTFIHTDPPPPPPPPIPGIRVSSLKCARSVSSTDSPRWTVHLLSRNVLLPPSLVQIVDISSRVAHVKGLVHLTSLAALYALDIRVESSNSGGTKCFCGVPPIVRPSDWCSHSPKTLCPCELVQLTSRPTVGTDHV